MLAASQQAATDIERWLKLIADRNPEEVEVLEEARRSARHLNVVLIGICTTKTQAMRKKVSGDPIHD